MKKILSAIAVAAGGFVLLNLLFLFYALITNFIGIFAPPDAAMRYFWFAPAEYILFLVILGLISWFVFRSKLKTIYKAIFLVTPVAAVCAGFGILFYHWQAAVYSLSGLFAAGVLYYFYRKKYPWLYYYAFILVGLAMLSLVIFHIEI